MSDDPRFDPRFDPAFQPGYTGPLAHERPARQRPPASAPEALPVVTAPSVPANGDPGVSENFQEPRDARPNPFLIALGAVAVLLVGGGLYVLSLLKDLAADAQSSQFDWITVQAVIFAAPLLVVLGLATGVSMLLIFAARWERR